MGSDRTVGPSKKQPAIKIGTYQSKKNMVHLLQDNNLIPMLFDPDYFLDVPGSEDNTSR